MPTAPLNAHLNAVTPLRNSEEIEALDRALKQFLVATRESNPELVVTILHESTEALDRRRPRGGALSDDQVAFLIDSGDFTEAEFADTEARVARGELAEEERKTRLEAITESLSTGEVSEILGIDDSRVRHRQSKGLLCSFLVGGKRRYPAWQFTHDAVQPVLPGLSALLKSLPNNMHPASVQGLMTSPQESLTIEGERVTPVEWLQHGASPEAVVHILDGLLRS